MILVSGRIIDDDLGMSILSNRNAIIYLGRVLSLSEPQNGRRMAVESDLWEVFQQFSYPIRLRSTSHRLLFFEFHKDKSKLY